MGMWRSKECLREVVFALPYRSSGLANLGSVAGDVKPCPDDDGAPAPSLRGTGGRGGECPNDLYKAMNLNILTVRIGVPAGIFSILLLSATPRAASAPQVDYNSFLTDIGCRGNIVSVTLHLYPSGDRAMAGIASLFYFNEMFPSGFVAPSISGLPVRLTTGGLS